MAKANTKESQVAGLLKNPATAVDSGQLLKDILERWGGTEKFARDVIGEFQGAKQNSLVRQKLMEMITKLVVTNTVHQITRTERPEDLETDEIEERLQALIRRVVNHVESKDAIPIKVSEPWAEEEESGTD